MLVSMFTNAFRTQLRLRVLTAARVALPATRDISSLVAFRTAVPKNVSLSVPRLFTTSQVARFESENNAPKIPPNNTLFVANMPWSTTEQDLSELFAEFGEVIGVRIHMNSEGRPRGMAHVDFANRESAIAAVDSAAQEPMHLAGRDLRIDFAVARSQQVNTEPSEKLYFSGFAGDESALRSLFKDFGHSIVDIHLLRNPHTGARTPAGFLLFTNQETATEALEALDGTETPEGEHLALSYARPRRNQSFSSQRDSGSRSFKGQGRKSSNRWSNES